MKRKDTKTYKKIIEKYCDLRYDVEYFSEEKHKNENRIFEKTLLKSKQTDPIVIAEIDNSIKLLKITNSLLNIYTDKESEMKKYEEILINDYGDNPDVIYKIYNKNNF